MGLHVKGGGFFPWHAVFILWFLKVAVLGPTSPMPPSPPFLLPASWSLQLLPHTVSALFRRSMVLCDSNLPPQPPKHFPPTSLFRQQRHCVFESDTQRRNPSSTATAPITALQVVIHRRKFTACTVSAPQTPCAAPEARSTSGFKRGPSRPQPTPTKQRPRRPIPY